MTIGPGDFREQLGRAVQAYQGAVDDFDRAVAQLLSVNETDLRCLELLLLRGQASPGELGTLLGITTGSVTAMIDRLERAGYLVREPHPTDGRRTSVRPTAALAEQTGQVFGPLVDSGEEILRRYDHDQLTTIIDFLQTATAIQLRHLDRLRHQATATGRTTKRVGRRR
jgi:DNA-binding MarR family transcriptional regulator